MDKATREPRKDEQQQTSQGREIGGTGNKEEQISLPKTERAEGPFEHSGETSGWTKEEEAEKKEQDQ